MLSFFIILPLVALIILNLPFRELMNRIVFVFASMLTLLQTAIVSLAIAGIWDIRAIPVSPLLRFNIGVDNLSLLLLLCTGLVIFVTVLVSKSFIPQGESRFNFISMLIIALCGANGIALARDIFSLYVFIEVVSISSFILIAFNKDRDAFEGAFKYIILSAIATIFMLSGIGLLFLISGNMSFEAISLAMNTSRHALLILFAAGVFLCGLFIKGGLVPFHGWLADAYTAASAPVSVYLAGIATKTLGIYTLIRIAVSVFGFDMPISNVFLFIGILSVVVGAIATLTQTDFKRMLAYSSISQIGYIVLGLGCASPLGIAAAAFHFFNHAVFKSLLFVNSAAVEKQSGTRDMDKLGGLSQRMPVTGVTSVLACLSAAGVPPLAGFWSKLLIIMALWNTAHYNYAAIAVLASLLTLAYMLLFQRKVFFGRESGHLASVKEGGWELVVPAIILAAITVGVGVFFPFNLCKLIIR
jgi:multicomponent Na+:H+ antiporter subunit D